ncbi:MAG: ATP-binding cassette domain-containing protein [Alphaproteobacteria bacterium]|nr:ATP-binding cassette domain-containing protein [Alphaproteobacteria bacterium]
MHLPSSTLSALGALAADDDGDAETATGLGWHHAVRLLLGAVGYQDDVAAATTPQQLAKLLRGRGFALTESKPVNGIIPTEEDTVGCLAGLENGNWLAILGAEEPVILTAAGDAAMPFAFADRHDVVSVWVLTERIINMGSAVPFLRRYKGYFLDLFVAAIIVNTFALVLPLFSSFVYDKILGNGIFDTLWALIIGIMIVAGIEFCVRAVRIAVAERFAVGSEVEIDHATFHNLLNMPANRMPGIGGLLEKYKQILSFRDFLSSSYLLAVADVPFLVLFLTTIAIVAGPLVFIPLTCGILLLLASILTTAPVLAYDRQARAASEKRFGLMTDLLSSREAVIGSALRNRLGERWRQSSVTAVLAASKVRYWRGIGATVANSISYISFVFVLAGGVYMVEGHSLTSGGLLAASMLSSRTMGVFASFVTLTLRYREFRTALRELNQLVPMSATKITRSHGRLHGQVRFDKVTCRLRAGDTPVLADISLNINPGEIVGIAGAPGAGKTTLMRLVAGVLTPDEGRILIDNIPIDQLSADDISQNIGFKPQDLCLLDGTVEDNVRAGRPPMTAEARREVLLASGLARVFDEGAIHWETDVGVRGTQLSGGQRQLVAMARTLLGRPAVLLLDEPTNGLDAALELHLARQLAAMRGHATVLVSSHSRNILSACDRIIVVGQSRILADGPRDQVMPA